MDQALLATPSQKASRNCLHTRYAQDGPLGRGDLWSHGCCRASYGPLAEALAPFRPSLPLLRLQDAEGSAGRSLVHRLKDERQVGITACHSRREEPLSNAGHHPALWGGQQISPVSVNPVRVEATWASRGALCLRPGLVLGSSGDMLASPLSSWPVPSPAPPEAALEEGNGGEIELRETGALSSSGGSADSSRHGEYSPGNSR
jgi:hypothetical protein